MTIAFLSAAMSLLAMAEPPPQRVVVSQLRALGGVDPGTAAILTDKLVFELRQSQRFSQVISPREMGELLTLEQSRQMVGCDEASCMAELAGALGAEQLATGSVGLVEGARVITLSILDTRTMLVTGNASQTIEGDEQGALVEGMERAVDQLLGLEHLAPPPPIWKHGWLYPAGVASTLLPPVALMAGLCGASCVGTYVYANNPASVFLFFGTFLAALLAGVGSVPVVGALIALPVLALWMGRGIFSTVDHLVVGAVIAVGMMTVFAGIALALVSVLMHVGWLAQGFSTGGADRLTGELFIAASTATVVSFLFVAMGLTTTGAGALAEVAAFLSRPSER